MYYTLEQKKTKKKQDFEDFELANPKGEDYQSANSSTLNSNFKSA